MVNEDNGSPEAVHIAQGSTLLFRLGDTVHAGVEGMLGQGPNYAVHLAHSLPFDEEGVYTVLSDTADGPSFDVQHASALEAITRKSLEGLVPTSGSETGGSEEEGVARGGEGAAGWGQEPPGSEVE